MRLIDADELKEAMEEHTDYKGYLVCAPEEVIDLAPTIEDRPHGEWIDKDYGIGKCWATCSECGESTNGEAQDHGFGYDYSFPNFCPNCGADMRKEGEAE